MRLVTTAIASRERRRWANATRRNGAPVEEERILLRAARPSDADALRRIASLDARSSDGDRLAALADVPEEGPVLVAEANGTVLAALDPCEGQVVADPFRHTIAARELLELRARQLRSGRDRTLPGWGELLSHLHPRADRA